MNLKQIGNYVVNPDSIAYIDIWKDKEGISIGSRIVFNAYTSAANFSDWAFEALYIEVLGLSPIEIMDFINQEAPF